MEKELRVLVKQHHFIEGIVHVSNTTPFSNIAILSIKRINKLGKLNMKVYLTLFLRRDKCTP